MHGNKLMHNCHSGHSKPCELLTKHFLGKGFKFDCVFQRLEREGKENEALNRMMANEQKSSLLNLFQEKNRPTLQKWPQVMPFSKLKDSISGFSMMLEGEHISISILFSAN